MLRSRWDIGCCCAIPPCSGQDAEQFFLVDPRETGYRARGIDSPPPELIWDREEATVRLIGTGSLTRQYDIHPHFDRHGHSVYLLRARVQKLAGSRAGAAILGRVALICDWDALVWRVYECNPRGQLSGVITELTIQDRPWSMATLYVIRRENGTAAMRLMATYTGAAPHHWVEHTFADGWPIPSEGRSERVWAGLLGFQAGLWDSWGLSCGRHYNGCHRGDELSEYYQSRWLVHSWHNHTASVLHDVFCDFSAPPPTPENPDPLRKLVSMGPAFQPTDNVYASGGSVYTEIHVPPDPEWEPLGELGVGALVEWGGGRIGCFLGHDLLIFDPMGDMIYWSACDDAGQPIGTSTPVRHESSFGTSTFAAFHFVRVRNPTDTGYNLLCYWNSSLVYKRAVDAGERILRLGVWWEHGRASLTLMRPLGFPLGWSCHDEAVVPCAGCHESFRRDPPIAIEVTLAGLMDHPDHELCSQCDLTRSHTLMINSWTEFGRYVHCRYGFASNYVFAPQYLAQSIVQCEGWPPLEVMYYSTFGCPVDEGFCPVTVATFGLPPFVILSGSVADWDGQSPVTIHNDCPTSAPRESRCVLHSVTLNPIHTPVIVSP